MRFFKGLFILITLTFFASLVQAAGQSETVEVIDWDKRNSNVLIYRASDEQIWLLHYEDDSCSFLEGETYIKLSTEDELDGYGPVLGDVLQPAGPVYDPGCKLDQAEVIDTTLYIQHVHSSQNSTNVRDENDPGKTLYQIAVGGGCNELDGHEKGTVYLQSDSQTLEEGATIFLPDKEGQCVILDLKVLEDEESESESSATVPPIVQQVIALPGNGQVTLFWEEVPEADRYLVGYWEYPVETDMKAKDVHMPILLETTDNKITILDLENNEPYFFYVVAEKDGEISSRWSKEVISNPQSYLSNKNDFFEKVNDPDATDIQIKETQTHFVFNWRTNKSYYNFELKEGSKVLMSSDLMQFKNNTYYFLKTPQRKGKVFELSINNKTVSFSL